MNPMQILNQVIQRYNIVQNNPQELGKLLLNSGRINQEQYEAVKDMSPSQMGNYLMSNGMLGQQQMQMLSQVIPQVQQMIGKR